MTGPTTVTDIEIAREFRLRRAEGATLNALAHPGLRLCLANCARLRKRLGWTDQPTPDGKRLASGDTD